MSAPSTEEFELRFLVSEFPRDKVESSLHIYQEYLPGLVVIENEFEAKWTGSRHSITLPQPVPFSMTTSLRQRFQSRSLESCLDAVRSNKILPGVQGFWTIKGDKSAGRGYELEWDITRPFDGEKFLGMRSLMKTRHLIPYLGMTIEVDVFNFEGRELIIAEVENPNPEFQKPSWFGEDITDNKAYSNWNMAL